MSARVAGVSRRRGHHFSKTPALSIRLVAGHGVEGDGHFGRTVKHRSRVARDPDQPNLRQVHLIHAELLDELQARFGPIGPGELGENILTRDIDLLDLRTGARLRIGATALVEITGLRNPCIQIDRFRSGLMNACLDRAPDGALVRKAGVMGIVIADGDVASGDAIERLPGTDPGAPLRPV
ncbi:MAG: MOSC domain-containing protein [Hyphomicrobiales bacterium]|nr:MOSC domain-containing protein [Hyphomicrobiales bacterium]